MNKALHVALQITIYKQLFASRAFFYTETVLGHEHCWRIIFAIMFPCIKLKGEDCVLKVFMVCIFPATRKTSSVLCRNRRVFREGEICTSTGTSKANNVSFTPSTMKWFEFLFHFLFFYMSNIIIVEDLCCCPLREVVSYFLSKGTLTEYTLL